MEFLLLDTDGDRVQHEVGFVYYPDFDSKSFLYDWVNSVTNLDSKEMCRVLNSINNQGIEWVDCQKFGYFLKGKQLPLTALSTGERVFFVAELARQMGVHVFLYRGVTQLTPTAMFKFFHEFASCEYVHVLCETEGQRMMFKRRGGIS